MDTRRKISRRAPVAIMGRMGAKRRKRRERQGVLDAEPATEPLPGSMLVLLSRLHRAERPPADEDDGPTR